MEKNWKEERLKNKKEIYFVLDTFEYPFISMPTIDCYSYLDTEEAIKCGCKRIRTYDLLHLSFDLLELGYRIYLVKDAKVLEVYPGMDNFSNKDIRFGHNLRRLLLGGFFDTMLDLDRNKFWYDTSMSTTDLCQQERNFQKATFDCALKVAQKTIGFDLTPMKFEDIGKNLQKLIEKCTNGKFTTNGANGITEQLIATRND